MVFRSVSFVYLVLLKLAYSTTTQDEKIDPVDLNFICIEPAVDSQKSPILFIHGITGSWSNWNSVSGLSNKTSRKACAVDLRNHGDSPWNDRGDIASMTEDIKHFLEKYSVKKVNLIGHSLGGKVSVDFSLKNPDIVNSIVVEDMRPNGVTELGLKPVEMGLITIRDAMKDVPEGSTVDEARKFMHDYIKQKIEEGVDTGGVNEYSPYYLDILCPGGKCRFKFNIDVLAKCVQDPNFLNGSDGLYRGPALFIYGELSAFDVRGDEDNILRLFPEVRLVEVKGGGHSIHGYFREFEDEVTKLLNSIAS